MLPEKGLLNLHLRKNVCLILDIIQDTQKDWNFGTQAVYLPYGTKVPKFLYFIKNILSLILDII